MAFWTYRFFMKPKIIPDKYRYDIKLQDKQHLIKTYLTADLIPEIPV